MHCARFISFVITLFLSAILAIYCNTTGSNIVNGGVYKIKSDNDQYVLSAIDNGVLSKKLGIVKIDVWSNSDEQKWTIRNSPNLIGGKQLRAITSRKNANNNLSFFLKNSGTSATIRYWEFISIGAGKWQLKSYPDGKCLQNMGRTRAAEEKTCESGNRSQRWEILICNSLRCSDRK